MSGIPVRDASNSIVEFENCAAVSARVSLSVRYPSQQDRLVREARVVALLDLLKVHIDSFAMCEIDDCCGLVVPPFDKLVVHYVLKGEGTIISDRGSLPIKAGMVIVIPKFLAKQINGCGSISTLCGIDTSCPLTPGIVKFSASSGSDGTLILACASVDASLGHRLALFEYLTEPLAFSDQNQSVALTFKAILQELSEPTIGTKALVDTLMKQILLLFLRYSLTRSSTAAPLEAILADCQITRAITIISARPQDPHTVDNLARGVGMSRSCFARIFAKTVGISPMRYVQVARLTLASALLKSSTIPVKSIAVSVGYASRSQFSRAFVTMFGADPTTFRHQANSSALAARDRVGDNRNSASPAVIPADHPRGENSRLW